jgi:hypothetical protein
MKTIENKITGYKIVPNSTESEVAETVVEEVNLELMHENLKRPDVLFGSTYKLKTPLSEHALYITMNDHILNEGTSLEKRHPYEIFINSKNLEHFQWVLALTRVISAVFRKGGDVVFLVEELLGVFDPKGGYLKKGQYVPSLVAEIGLIIKQHFLIIGMIKEEVDPNMEAFIKAKREQFAGEVNTNSTLDGFNKSMDTLEKIIDSGQGLLDNQWPPSSTLCSKCNVVSVVLMDGCKTCLNCGDSKCG